MTTANGVKPGKVLLVGEPMGLFSANQEGPLSEVGVWAASVAGAELNVAIGLKRLGQDPLYMTKIGDDPLGERIMAFLSANGLDTSLVRVDGGHHTGFMMKSRVSEGDPKTFYYRKDSAASTLDADDVEKLDWTGISLTHITGILPPLSDSTLEAAYALVDQSRAHGAFVSFDPNLRPALWKSEDVMKSTLRRLAARADLVMPGIGEGQVLFGASTVEDTAKAFLDNGAKIVIVKDGPRGAYASDGSVEIRVPGFVVDHVVDTVGAGDGFAAGVLSSLLEGGSLADSMERGCALGAIQTQQVSDNEGLPTPDQLAAFTAGHRRAF
ncbi:2-dehydro-3-deoxygluconokinase [Bifidobacterium lemurum]|uniref:2-dehydro-3-deoxygluconokinase n=1 Tax=Bifidobacterium lemurum TaxID=1603886 RepID=A0A261FXD0_9BIFI|nr:sugar kinase [Bifidobacterium lemurum]OZG63416.1 2-dehydro-3-deoxygluconokinase [Bifidobacterium lemurum]QOL34321.1 sugar kinase [Bifidobacterium lemurum]